MDGFTQFLMVVYMINCPDLQQVGTVEQEVAHSRIDMSSILNSGDVCVKFTHSPRDRVGFPWKPWSLAKVGWRIGYFELSLV